MTEQINKTRPLATKVTKYVEAKVVIEPGYKPNFYYLKTEAERTSAELKFYRSWADELKKFFRDHRHQDVNQVYVDVTEVDACSKRGESWETYIEEETGDTCCACCGALVKPRREL